VISPVWHDLLELCEPLARCLGVTLPGFTNLGWKRIGRSSIARHASKGTEVPDRFAKSRHGLDGGSCEFARGCSARAVQIAL
jgi:hypothetical protein